VVSALFGGISVTGTIARTATNIRAGARSPVAGMMHAAFLLAFMVLAPPRRRRRAHRQAGVLLPRRTTLSFLRSGRLRTRRVVGQVAIWRPRSTVARQKIDLRRQGQHALQAGRYGEDGQQRQHPEAECGGIGCLEATCTEPLSRQQRRDEHEEARESLVGDEALARQEPERQGICADEERDQRGATDGSPGGRAEKEQDDRRAPDAKSAVQDTR